MLVSQVLKEKGDMVFTCSPHETMGAAAAMLYARRVGAMVVTDEGGNVAGILSERDLVRAIAEGGAQALSRLVADFMSLDVVFADPAEAVDALLGRMTDRRVRHLPVCRHKQLIGIVSIGDLVKAKIAEIEAEAGELKNYIAAS